MSCPVTGDSSVKAMEVLDDQSRDRHHNNRSKSGACEWSLSPDKTYRHRDGKAASVGFPAGISARHESAAGKLDLEEEVWPFSPYVLKGNWRTKLAQTRLEFPPWKDATELRDRPVEILAGGVKRRRGSKGEEESPRSSRTVSGWLAVVEAVWQIVAGGGGGGGGRGERSWRSLYFSIHVRRRASVTSKPREGGDTSRSAFRECRKTQTQFSERLFETCCLQGLLEILTFFYLRRPI